MLPPVHYSAVSPGIYRSAYFKKSSYDFIQKLNLKSAVCLDIFEVKPEFREFLSENKINFVQCDVGFNQEPFLVMSDEKVCEVLRFLLNPDNQPTLLFCRDGKIKTSTVIGCLRAVTEWSLVSTIDEFESYVGEGGNWHDIQFIETFGKTMKIKCTNYEHSI